MTYEIFIPCSESLRFETTDTVISIQLANISLAQVTQDDKGQTRVNISLKDGRELTGLRPVQPTFRINGMLFIAGTLNNVSGNMSWERLHEIKSLKWQKPVESDIWKSLKSPPYLKIKLKSNPFLITARGIRMYSERQDLDTGLSHFGIGPGIEVRQLHDELWREIRVTVDRFIFNLPLEQVSQLSQTEKVLISKNSQKILFNALGIPGDSTNIIGVDTAFGRLVFRLSNDNIKQLEFTDTAPDWNYLPRQDLIEYAVTDTSNKEYRTKQITTSFIVSDRDIPMRCLTNRLAPEYYVEHHCCPK